MDAKDFAVAGLVMIMTGFMIWGYAIMDFSSKGAQLKQASGAVEQQQKDNALGAEHQIETPKEDLSPVDAAQGRSH